MSFFKNLFGGDKNNDNIFASADDLITKLTARYMVAYYDSEHETTSNRGAAWTEYNKAYFETLNSFPSFKASQRHLCKITTFEPKGQNLNTFLKKTSSIINVFGNIVDVDRKAIRIIDLDNSNKAEMLCSVNLLYNDEQKSKVDKLRKEQRVELEVIFPDEVKLHDMSSQTPYAFQIITLDQPEMITRIVNGGKIRYDITGRLTKLSW